MCVSANCIEPIPGSLWISYDVESQLRSIPNSLERVNVVIQSIDLPGIRVDDNVACCTAIPNEVITVGLNNIAMIGPWLCAPSFHQRTSEEAAQGHDAFCMVASRPSSDRALFALFSSSPSE